MSIRKEKEKDFFVHHMETFRKMGNADPAFMIKTAFFQKGKYGRQVQFFESELKKGTDLYIEFYENVKNEKGEDIDIVPLYPERQLFKLKSNPYFEEEYEKKESLTKTGDTYSVYTIPVSEMSAVLTDGSVITYNLFEKRKADADKKEAELPRLQNKVFPDFEEDFGTKKAVALDSSLDDALLQEITLRDLAALMLMKPVSNKQWLNELIKPNEKAPWE
jgi:hypothetical protein